MSKEMQEMKEKAKEIAVRPTNLSCTEFTSELYHKIGEEYWKRLEHKKHLLPAAIKAYLISAENLSRVLFFQ
jgi:hypothetical protein